MPDEEAPFLARATSAGQPQTVGLAVHRRVDFGGRDVLLVRTGIGLVNAAGAATSAILATAPGSDGPGALVISAGTAGGVGEQVRVGDVVIGTEYINIDADARAFGYVLGQVPRMPASYSGSDAALRAFAGSGHAAAVSPATVHLGLIASSYSFVTPQRAASIRSALPAASSTWVRKSLPATGPHRSEMARTDTNSRPCTYEVWAIATDSMSVASAAAVSPATVPAKARSAASLPL
jgi:adenosylhomocysteine nucleosidase